MKSVTDIIISVELTHEGEHLTSAEVLIPIPKHGKLQVGIVIDACQRAVSHCVEELQKHLDLS